MINILALLQVSIFIFSAQVGSGFFLLPALLSSGGYWSILVIGFIGLCGVLIISAFVQSEKNIQELIEVGFNKQISKVFFFIYWFISWFSTVVLFKELTGYLGLSASNGLYVEMGVWLVVTFLNIWKLEYTLYIETFLTIIKLIPFVLLLIAFIVGVKSGTVETLKPININLFIKCVWCFVGLETGSIISKNLKVSRQEQKLGTYIGMAAVVGFYLLSIGLSFYMVGNRVLVNNSAPYITILTNSLSNLLSHSTIQWFVRSLVVLSLIGSINSWTISSGYTADECGKRNILPKFLSYRNNNGVPYIGILFSSVLVLISLVLCNSNNIYKIIAMSIDISCCFFIAIYGVCLLSYGKVFSRSLLSKITYNLLGIILLIIFVIEFIRYSFLI